MTLRRIAVVSAFIGLGFAISATAVPGQTVSPEKGRDIPAYTPPVPEDISPEIRPLVAAPPLPWDIHPKSIAEWKELVAKVAAPAKALLPAMREKLGVKLEQATIGGVNVFVLSPQTIAPENQNRVFIHFHGGAYVLNPGEPGTREGILMAAFGRAKVISVDYRTSSDAPYPAALDDCVADYPTPQDRIAAKDCGVRNLDWRRIDDGAGLARPAGRAAAASSNRTRFALVGHDQDRRYFLQP
jgi:hypothetical protein